MFDLLHSRHEYCFNVWNNPEKSLCSAVCGVTCMAGPELHCLLSGAALESSSSSRPVLSLPSSTSAHQTCCCCYSDESRNNNLSVNAAPWLVSGILSSSCAVFFFQLPSQLTMLLRFEFNYFKEAHFTHLKNIFFMQYFSRFNSFILSSLDDRCAHEQSSGFQTRDPDIAAPLAVTGENRGASAR